MTVPTPRLSAEQRREYHALVRERDGDACWICGAVVPKGGRPACDPRRPTLDHVIERRHGGSNEPENLRLAHFGCNNARTNGQPTETRSKARRKGKTARDVPTNRPNLHTSAHHVNALDARSDDGKSRAIQCNGKSSSIVENATQYDGRADSMLNRAGGADTRKGAQDRGYGSLPLQRGRVG
jgi:hypothetical protein